MLRFKPFSNKKIEFTLTEVITMKAFSLCYKTFPGYEPHSHTPEMRRGSRIDSFLVVVLGLFLGEYSKHSAAAGFLVLGVLAAAATLDEAGLAFAGTFRRLLLVSTTTEHQAGHVAGILGAGRGRHSSHRERSRSVGIVTGLTPAG